MIVVVRINPDLGDACDKKGLLRFPRSCIRFVYHRDGCGLARFSGRGNIALNEGNVAEAKQRLRAAASIKKGSAPLGSFGRDMLLAKRLFEKGETQAVIEYLELCAYGSLTDPSGRVAELKAAINAKEMPNFLGNLIYYSESWRSVK